MKTGDVVQCLYDEDFIGVVVEFHGNGMFTFALVLLQQTPIKRFGYCYPKDLIKLM